MKLTIEGSFLQVYDSVALCGGYLRAGNALFLKLLADVLAHLFRKLAAGLALHGDVVFAAIAEIKLLLRGYAV